MIDMKEGIELSENDLNKVTGGTNISYNGKTIVVGGVYLYESEGVKMYCFVIDELDDEFITVDTKVEFEGILYNHSFNSPLRKEDILKCKKVCNTSIINFRNVKFASSFF